MQSPEGHLELSDEMKKLLGKEKTIGEVVEDQLSGLRKKAASLERETGKPHPIFTVGEELEIKGGRFKVHLLMKDRLILKPIKY